jgi:hypothetical protein
MKLRIRFDIKLTKEMLNDEVPLIGFAGSPWTIMCYAEGKGSKSLIWPRFCFNIQKQHMFYCKKLRIPHFIPQRKSKSGVNAVQILTLGRNVVSSGLSRIHGNTSTKLSKVGRCNTRNCFGKGCWFALNEMGKVELLHLEWIDALQEMQDTCLVEISLYKGILIHQDYISIPVSRKWYTK